MKDLLKGFSGNFGVPGSGDDPTTLLELIEWIRSWCKGEVSTDRLASAIEQLAQRCQRAALDTARDVSEGVALDQALEDTLASLKESFEDASEELTIIHTLVRNGQSVESSIEALEVLQEEIAQLSRCLEGWTSGREPLCIRCGSKGPERSCPQCRLERLVPDPQPESEMRSAHLGPQYLTLYQIYRGIMDGDSSLSALEPHLQPLETELRLMLRLARAGSFPLVEEAELGLKGLAQMRAALTSRQARDLNEGWSQVFYCATAMMEKLPDLLRKSGKAGEAKVLENSRRFEDNTRMGG